MTTSIDVDTSCHVQCAADKAPAVLVSQLASTVLSMLSLNLPANCSAYLPATLINTTLLDATAHVVEASAPA